MSSEDSVQAAKETVVEAFGRTAELYGASRSVGRVYGRLFFAEDPTSLDELVERTGYAKSTVSTATSTLERFHLVHRRSIKGEGKRAYFEANRDLWVVFQRFMDHQVSREVRIMLEALEEAEATLEAADSPQADRNLERVRSLRETYDRAQTAVRALSRLPVDRLHSLFDGLTGGTDNG